jgi:hypothetical protein
MKYPAQIMSWLDRQALRSQLHKRKRKDYKIIIMNCIPEISFASGKEVKKKTDKSPRRKLSTDCLPKNSTPRKSSCMRGKALKMLPTLPLKPRPNRAARRATSRRKRFCSGSKRLRI